MGNPCRWENPLEYRHLFVQVLGGTEDVAGGVSSDAEPAPDR